MGNTISDTKSPAASMAEVAADTDKGSSEGCFKSTRVNTANGGVCSDGDDASGAHDESNRSIAAPMESAAGKQTEHRAPSATARTHKQKGKRLTRKQRKELEKGREKAATEEESDEAKVIRRAAHSMYNAAFEVIRRAAHSMYNAVFEVNRRAGSMDEASAHLGDNRRSIPGGYDGPEDRPTSEARSAVSPLMAEASGCCLGRPANVDDDGDGGDTSSVSDEVAMGAFIGWSEALVRSAQEDRYPMPFVTHLLRNLHDVLNFYELFSPGKSRRELRDHLAVCHAKAIETFIETDKDKIRLAAELKCLLPLVLANLGHCQGAMQMVANILNTFPDLALAHCEEVSALMIASLSASNAETRLQASYAVRAVATSGRVEWEGTIKQCASAILAATRGARKSRAGRRASESLVLALTVIIQHNRDIDGRNVDALVNWLENIGFKEDRAQGVEVMRILREMHETGHPLLIEDGMTSRISRIIKKESVVGARRAK